MHTAAWKDFLRETLRAAHAYFLKPGEQHTQRSDLGQRPLIAAQDATRKQIGVGDIVDITAGRVKGKSGTVKFIHRQGLFLHVR